MTVGPERAPHRSFLYAMGLSAREIAKPFVGVATTWNEAAPCNIALLRQAQVAKRGDIIEIDAHRGVLALHIDDPTLAARRARWQPRRHSFQSATIWRYVQTVGPANYSAVTHPGAAAEAHVYADI